MQRLPGASPGRDKRVTKGRVWNSGAKESHSWFKRDPRAVLYVTRMRSSPPPLLLFCRCFSVFSGIPCNLESDRALYVTRGFTEPLGFQLCLRAREIWTLANGIREFFLSRWKRGGGGARGSWAWGGGSKGICLVKDNNRLLGIGWFGNRTRSFRHLENVWFSNWSGIFLSFFFFCWIRIELSGDRMRNFLVRWEFFRIFRTILIKRKFEEGIFNDQVDYLSRRRNLNRYLWS